MGRTFVDAGLMSWEAYASTGDFGFSENSRLVFQCLSDPGRRARYLSQVGDKADAERAISTASDAELAAMLDGAREVR